MSCGEHEYKGKHPRCEKCGMHRAWETIKKQHLCHPCSRILRGLSAIKSRKKKEDKEGTKDA